MMTLKAKLKNKNLCPPYCLESFHGLETQEPKRQVIAPYTLQTYIDDIK